MIRRMGSWLWVLAAVMGVARAASATTVCVSTTSGLRNALNAWQTASDQTYTIKLVQGTYLYPNADYWTQPYYGGNANLQLLGGYTAGCASRSLVASNTVLDGQQASREIIAAIVLGGERGEVARFGGGVLTPGGRFELVE